MSMTRTHLTHRSVKITSIVAIFLVGASIVRADNPAAQVGDITLENTLSGEAWAVGPIGAGRYGTTRRAEPR